MKMNSQESSDEKVLSPLRRRQRKRRSREFLPFFFASTLTTAMILLFLLQASSGSGFPGTIKHSPGNTANEWWQHNNGNPNSASTSSTNNGNDSDEESSSDWEWERDDAETKTIVDSSSDGETDELNKESNQSGPTAASNSQEEDASLAVSRSRTSSSSSNVASPPFRNSSSSNTRPPRPPPRVGQPASSNSAATLSNKPLQTLEKLQHMLDETDYMSSPAARAPSITEDFSSGDEEWISEGEQGDDEGMIAQPPPQEMHHPQQQRVPSPIQQGQQQTHDSLWTSKDRSKYKKQRRQQQQLNIMGQQQRQSHQGQLSRPQPPPPPPQQQRQQEYRSHEYYQQLRRRQQLQQQQRIQRIRPQVQPSSQAVFDVEENYDETDDGLGYTLPNLPVYLSDAEDAGESEPDSALSPVTAANAAATMSDGSASSTQQQQQQQQEIISPQQLQQQQPYPPPPNGMMYPAYPPPAVYGGNPPPPQWYNAGADGSPSTGGTAMAQIPPYGPNSNYGYMPPPPSFYYANPQASRQQQQPQQQQQQNTGYGPYYGHWYPTPSYYPRSFVPRIDTTAGNKKTARLAPPASTASIVPPSTFVSPAQQIMPHGELSPTVQKYPSTRLSFWSVLELSTCLIFTTVLCYAAVSPREISMLEYNLKFYENLRLASLTVIAPLLVFLLILDLEKNNVNRLISGFANAFTFGYVGCFASQVVAATVIRLGIFVFWEPKVFDLAPEVPLPIIPWVLREHKYRPKRITLFIQDFITSCVVCPVIEEFAKLLVLQKCAVLPKNFNWVTRRSKNNHKAKQVAEPVSHVYPNDEEVINVNHYVSSMLAVSLGLKLADSIRRVCMYTKASHVDKPFYAVFRGIFPIHELCGIVTVLSLARRDVLGQPMPLWKLLLPSAIIHGMANFRGMKPIFKWNSATPWSEMQLSPDFMTEGTTFAQLAVKAAPKIMWLIILCRVCGYCVKNYYMINRQAVKRTTTFAGKHSAFSAELAAAEMLKNKNKKKKDNKK